MKITFLIFLLAVFLQNNGFTQCYSAGQNLPNTGYIVNSSGHDDLDLIVKSEINKLQLFFGVKIDFYFLIEEYQSNAMYTPICNSNCNGTIFLGVNLLYEKLLLKDHGVEIVKAILAHEFGHCIQHLIGWSEPGKRQELHSDFMAGYYTGKMYNYTDEQLTSLYSEFFNLGDSNFWSPNHHGTSTERQCAFLEGFYFAKENTTTITIANSYAIQYVIANDPCIVRKYKAAIQYVQTENNNQIDQFQKDLSSHNVGSIKFIAADNKKYKIITTNGYGQKVEFYLNKKYKIRDKNGKKIVVQPLKEVVIKPLSAERTHDYYVYNVGVFSRKRFFPKSSSRVKKQTISNVIITENKLVFKEELDLNFYD